jgi:hypothetical protein
MLGVVEQPSHSHHLRYAHFGQESYLQFSSEDGALISNGHLEYCTDHRCFSFILNRAGRLKIMNSPLNTKGI